MPGIPLLIGIADFPGVVKLRRDGRCAIPVFFILTDKAERDALSVALEVLNGAFVFHRRLSRLECSKIPALTRFWIELPGVEPEFACLELSDHLEFPLLNKARNVPLT